VLWLGAAVAVVLGVTIAVATTHGSGDAAALAITPHDAAPVVVIATAPDAAPPDAAEDDELVIDEVGGCDADAWVTAGTAEEARGNHVEAIAQYDRALGCKFDPHSLQLAFMAACNGSVVASARRYWRKMSPDMQSHMIQICLHNHITADILNEEVDAATRKLRAECHRHVVDKNWSAVSSCADKLKAVDPAVATALKVRVLAELKAAAACNADDLVTAGTAAEARGEHAAALISYDAALKCRFDTHSLQLAFMASCNGTKVDHARKYWKRMSPDMQAHIVQICVHNHITAEMLNR
jgi:tetratricopeptide (TPR) repeat protein